MSRNGKPLADDECKDNVNEDEIDEAVDNYGNKGKGSRKGNKGTKTTSRATVAQTIERNPAALNAVKLENDYAVDPMFHKISKAFDEGGAKGMLMNNLVS